MIPKLSDEDIRYLASCDAKFSDIGNAKRAMLVEFFDNFTVQELNRFLIKLKEVVK